jgi:uncharacterized protein
MRLTFATDLHGQMILIEKFLEQSVMENADVIILGGDICPRAFGSLDARIRIQREFLEKQLIPLLERFHQENMDKVIFAMFGNDDYRVNYPIYQDAERRGIFHLPNGPLRIWDMMLVMYNHINTSPFMLKDWEKEDFEEKEIEGVTTAPRTDWKPIISDLRAMDIGKKTILVTHAPPFDTRLDMIHSKDHVGSKAIRAIIEDKQPILVLSGHIHESMQMTGSYHDLIGRTLCMNPGSDPFKQRSGMLIVEIDSYGIGRHKRKDL